MTRDARGARVVAPADETGVARGPHPGAVAEPDVDTGPEGGGWRIRADVRLGPLTIGDRLTDDQGRTFYVRTAKDVKVPGVPDVDFIRVLADLDPPLRA